MAIIDHQISMRLEMAGRSALGLEGRGGLYGVIDADYIDVVGNAFTVLIASLAPYYKTGDSDVKNKIDSFLEKYNYLSDKDGDKSKYSKGVEESAKELRQLVKEFNN